MNQILIIALGGSIGASFRFLTGFLAVKLFGKSEVMTGTVLANIIGCLLAGILLGLVSAELLLTQSEILFLTIGLLGSYTTFSTFALEAYQIGKQSVLKLFVYLFLQLVVAFLATISGYGFIQLISGA